MGRGLEHQFDNLHVRALDECRAALVNDDVLVGCCLCHPIEPSEMIPLWLSVICELAAAPREQPSAICRH